MEYERKRSMHTWMCERVSTHSPFHSGKYNPFGYPEFNENQFQLILGCYMHEHG